MPAGGHPAGRHSTSPVTACAARRCCTSSVPVTDAAGCGKYAALARLVTLSDPDFCGQYRSQAEIPAGLRPEKGALDAAMLATSKLPHEFLAQLCAALEIPAPQTSVAARSLAEWRQAWRDGLAGRGRSVTVVLDGLDEAGLGRVLTEFNRPDGAKPLVRLIVGVRSPGGGPDDTTSELLRGALPRGVAGHRGRHGTEAADQPGRPASAGSLALEGTCQAPPG